MKEIPYPNKADDVAFEQLGRMIADTIYLQRGIDSRKQKLKELYEVIMKEERRLSIIGYDVSKVKIQTIKGVEL